MTQIKEKCGNFTKRIIWFFKKYVITISIIFFILDRIIKEILFSNNLNYVKNYGISFGLFSQFNWLIINSIFISLMILIWVFSKEDYSNLLILIITGGIGNLIDRIIYGFVIDYIPFIFSIINLSDLLVSLGVILIALNEIINSRNKDKQILKSN